MATETAWTRFPTIKITLGGNRSLTEPPKSSKIERGIATAIARDPSTRPDPVIWRTSHGTAIRKQTSPSCEIAAPNQTYLKLGILRIVQRPACSVALLIVLVLCQNKVSPFLAMGSRCQFVKMQT